MAGGERVPDDHAEVVTGDGEALMAETGHQGGHVPGEGGHVVAGGGLVAGSDPAHVGRDDREVLGEGGHHQTPAVPELRPGGEQQQRRTVPAGHSVQGQPVHDDGAAGERVGEAVRQVRNVGHGERHRISREWSIKIIRQNRMTHPVHRNTTG